MELISKPNVSEETLELHDFESLLRNSLEYDQVQVIEYKATRLMPPGENYTSVMLKIEATIRHGKPGKLEQLHLVGKMMQKTDEPIVDWPLILKKEIFVYRYLIFAYRDLERAVGIKEDELIDLLPKYIGHRYSLDGSSDEADEHSILLMENIKARGFYNCKRSIGLDYRHACKALSSLARYHVLGIVMKHKRPDYFEKVLAQAQVLGVDLKQLAVGLDSTLKELAGDPSLVRNHLPVIEACFERFRSFAISPTNEQSWTTITHGDFWTNNIMFHKDAQGNVDDLKFVDFQMYFHVSALRDLPNFIFSSIDDDAFDRHLDELLDVYYESFVKTIRRMGIDSKAYTKESFNNELKIQALDMFPICAMAPKFIVLEPSQEEDSEQSLLVTVFKSESNELAKDKMRRLVRTYEERGWF